MSMAVEYGPKLIGAILVLLKGLRIINEPEPFI